MTLALKIKKFLISPKTIVLLIVITLVACCIGFFVPQAADKSPSFFETWQEKNIYSFRLVTRLQLHRVYTSYWFFTLVLLLQSSLIASLYQQVKINLKHKALRRDYRKQTTDNKKEKGQNEGQLGQVRTILHKHKYSERGSAGHTVIFSKNSISRWGSVIFHSGLLLIIISALLVVCFQKRGFVQLIERETFDGEENNLLVREPGLFADEFNTGFETSLSAFTHEYWPNKKVKFLESELYIGNGHETLHKTLTVNNPLLINGTNIYQSFDYGYTLSFTLKKTNGEEIISNFNIDRASDVSMLATGTSDFPMSPYIIEMKFIPDLEKKTYSLNKPIVHLNISEGLNTVFSGLLVPGSAIKIKEDILQFTGVRYWSGLIYVKNPAMPIAYIGFAVVIIGIAIMFLLPYKEIDVSVDPATEAYCITGMTKRYQAIFNEELEEIRKEIHATITLIPPDGGLRERPPDIPQGGRACHSALNAESRCIKDEFSGQTGE